jgi:hypothetical protein
LESYQLHFAARPILPAAGDHEAATQAALQSVLQQDRSDISIQEVTNLDSCVDVEGAGEELRTLD